MVDLEPKYTTNMCRNVLPEFPAPTFDQPITELLFDDLSEESKEDLKKAGLAESPTRARVWVGLLSFNNLKAVMKMGAKETNPKPGNVSLDATIAYFYAINAARLFSDVSVVAFQPCDAIRFDPKILEDPDHISLLNAMEKVPTSFKGDEEKISVTVDAAGANRLVFMPRQQIILPVFGEKKIHNQWAKAGSDPIWDKGTFFKYFLGLVVPDTDFVGTTFCRFFFKCLARDTESCQRIWGRIRKGLRQLAPTRAGMAISHLYCGIVYAATSQTCIVPFVTKGVYNGFALYGNFQMVIRGSLRKPDDKETLKLEFSKINAHANALSIIVRAINSVMDEDGASIFEIKKINIDTSQKFADIYSSLPLSFLADAEKKKFHEAIEELSYEESYQGVNPRTIKLFLEYVHTGDESLLDGYPRYLGSGNYLDQGRVARGLSIFGPSAPSFNSGVDKGDQKIVFSSQSPDINLLQDENGFRKLQSLAWKMRPIRISVGDNERLFNSSTMFIPPGRKGKKEAWNMQKLDGTIGGNMMPELYNIMKKICLDRGKKGGSEKRKSEFSEGSSKDRVKRRKAEAQQSMNDAMILDGM